MSGAMSIPFAFLALIFGGKSAVWFALLAVAASWVTIVRMAYANQKSHRMQNGVCGGKLDIFIKLFIRGLENPCAVFVYFTFFCWTPQKHP
jgi:hypothetical protein